MKGFRAVVCEPGYSAYETEFRDAEDAVTQVVGEEYDLHFWAEQENVVMVYCTQQDGLPFNRKLDENGDIYVNGKILICGWNGKKLCGITKSDAAFFQRKYQYVNRYEERNGEMISFSTQPRAKPYSQRLRKQGWRLER